MDKNVKTLITICLIGIIALCSFMTFLDAIDGTDLYEVEGEHNINWLDSRDDSDYEDIKEHFEKMLYKEKGKRSEKTVIRLEGNIFKYAECKIFFKINGKWYKTSKGRHSDWITEEISEKLQAIWESNE